MITGIGTAKARKGRRLFVAGVSLQKTELSDDFLLVDKLDTVPFLFEYRSTLGT